MAFTKPFFITGANATINLNGVTVAFATDVSYRISVDHASPRVLGRFEVEVHQPLKYDVSGNLTIIRYAKGVAGAIGAPHPAVGDSDGNGVGTLGSGSSSISSILNLPSGTPDGKANENFDPSRLLQSTTFDIDIFQNVDGERCQIAKLRGCRMVETEFRVSKRSAASQSFRFVAQYADEDSFGAGKSGVGQELS